MEIPREQPELQATDRAAGRPGSESLEFYDAGIRALLGRVERAETELQSAGDIDTKDEIVSRIYLEWREKIDDGAEFTFSGAARPFASSDLNILTGHALDYRVDADNSLFFLNQVKVNVVGIKPVGDGLAIHCQLIEATGRTEFYAFAGEINTLNPENMTREGLETLLDEYYPEIYLALRQLSDHSDDDEQIILELMGLRITTDFSKTENLIDTERLISEINYYVTDRVGFDICDYSLTISGVIEGIGGDFELMRSEFAGALEQLQIRGVILRPDPSNQNRLIPYLEATQLSTERGEGRVILYIPVSSIFDIKNHRPTGYSVFANPEQQSVDDNANDDASPTLGEIDDTRAESAEYRRLTAIEAEITEISQALSRIVMEPSASAQDSVRRLENFYKSYSKRLLELRQAKEPLRFSGEIVQGGGVELKVMADERGSREVNATIHPLQPADILSTKSGYFVGVYLAEARPGEYPKPLNAYLIIHDIEQSKDVDGTFYSLSIASRFLVDVSNGVNFEIPPLARMKRQRLAHERIGKFDAEPYIKATLNELLSGFDEEDELGVADIESGLIRKIGEMVGPSTISKLELDDLVWQIIGPRSISVESDYYFINGVIGVSEGFTGNLIGVVSSVPGVALSGLAFVIEVNKERRYVPFSQIREIAI